MRSEEVAGGEGGFGERWLVACWLGVLRKLGWCERWIAGKGHEITVEEVD